MALFTFRRRSDRSRRTATSTTATAPNANAAAASPPSLPRHPEAIPCYNYYDIFPEDAGPMGHVVIDDGDDMRAWRLIATPIAPEEALKKGGCIQYVSEETKANPEYYEFTHDAEEVYGSAAYEKMLPGSPNGSDYVATKAFPAPKYAEVNTSYGGLSDDGVIDAQTLAG